MPLKYHVMLVNGSNYEISVLYTANDKSDCYMFMSEYLKDKITVDGRYSKAFHESESIISVYEYHYIVSKSLKCKLVLVEYNDIQSV